MEITNAFSFYNDKKLIIFLAEDDEDDADLFRETFEKILSKAKITVLENGDLMMLHLQKKTEIPDIIFLDLNMPKKNGTECLIEIKTNQEFKKIKTVILSTTSDEKQIQICYELGADHFITKPTNIRTFQKLISECLETLNVFEQR